MEISNNLKTNHMNDKNIEEKAKEYAGITPDVNNVDKLPNQFVFVKEKYFSFVAGYTQAVTDQSDILTQYKEALRDIIPLAERAMDDIRTLVSERELITKVRQLLTDKE